MAKVVRTARILDIECLEILTTDIEVDGRTEKCSVAEGGTSTNYDWISVCRSKGSDSEGRNCEDLNTSLPKE